jgi:hypothetical protein
VKIITLKYSTAALWNFQLNLTKIDFCLAEFLVMLIALRLLTIPAQELENYSVLQNFSSNFPSLQIFFGG